MELSHLTTDTFDQAVNAGEELVVVDFSASWCGPCKMLAPILERAADAHPEVHFYKVDIDEEPELTTRFKIMSVPMLLFMKKGEVVSKSVGLVPASELESLITDAK